MMTVSNGEEGVTLLEALVALAILASALTAVFSVVTTSHISQARADVRWRMALLADALVQNVGLETDLAQGRWNGSREDLSWSLDVTPHAAESTRGRSLQLYEVRVSVSSEVFGESIALASLRLSERRP